MWVIKDGKAIERVVEFIDIPQVKYYLKLEKIPLFLSAEQKIFLEDQVFASKEELKESL